MMTNTDNDVPFSNLEGFPQPKIPAKLKSISSLWDFDVEEIARYFNLKTISIYHFFN